jgi:hypothetical protein
MSIQRFTAFDPMLRDQPFNSGLWADAKGQYVTYADHLAALRACEVRVREDERSSNFTPDDHSNGMTESYHRGFDAARWIAAKEALEGVQHENCDCEPCQAIARALAELWTIGQD